MGASLPVVVGTNDLAVVVEAEGQRAGGARDGDPPEAIVVQHVSLAAPGEARGGSCSVGWSDWCCGPGAAATGPE